MLHARHLQEELQIAAENTRAGGEQKGVPGAHRQAEFLQT